MKRDSLTRLLTALLVLILLLGCTGCAKSGGTSSDGTGWNATPWSEQEEETAAPTEDAEPEQTEPAPDLSNLVTDAYHTQFDYTDYSGETATVDLHIPRIELQSPEIEALNAKLLDEWRSDAEYSLESIEEYGMPSLGQLQYVWYVNGDILTLELTAEWPCDDGFTGTEIYSVLISERREASADEILAAAGVDRQRYETLTAQALASRLIDSVYDYRENIFGEYLRFEDFYEQTVSAENIAEAMPYLNEEGHLSVLGQYFIPAGGGVVTCCIDLETFTLSPHYSEMVGES